MNKTKMERLSKKHGLMNFKMRMNFRSILTFLNLIIECHDNE